MTMTDTSPTPTSAPDPRAIAYTVTLTIIDTRSGRSRADVRTAVQDALAPCTLQIDAAGFVLGDVEIAEVLR